MTTSRPNILLIACDQLYWGACGFLGGTEASTPNMDRLARRGVSFARAYCASPVCTASRAAFWTGKLPSQNGIYENSQHPDPARHYTGETMGTVFSRAGYQCLNFGKNHAAGALRGFTCDDCFDSDGIKDLDTLELPGGTASKADRHLAHRVGAFLRQPGHGPFLLSARVDNPHDICRYRGKHQGEHENPPLPGDDQLPPLSPAQRPVGDLDARPLPIRRMWQDHLSCRDLDWNEANKRHYVWAYHRYVERADAVIGQILDALDNGPYADNTLVVFFADHGEALIYKDMLGKGTQFYEETARVPFVFAGPLIPRHGTTSAEALVSLCDLLPTLADYAGVPLPKEPRYGLSLRSHLDRGEPVPRTAIVSEWREFAHNRQTGRMLRTARYKYTHYLRDGGEELFDLVNDPDERRSLHNDPASADELARHRRLLDEHLAQVADDYRNLPVIEEEATA